MAAAFDAPGVRPYFERSEFPVETLGTVIADDEFYTGLEYSGDFAADRYDGSAFGNRQKNEVGHRAVDALVIQERHGDAVCQSVLDERMVVFSLGEFNHFRRVVHTDDSDALRSEEFADLSIAAAVVENALVWDRIQFRENGGKGNQPVRYSVDLGEGECEIVPRNSIFGTLFHFKYE